MENKGKQKAFLYKKRCAKKILRYRKRLKRGKYSCHVSKHNSASGNFLSIGYKDVVEFLDEHKFCLPQIKYLPKKYETIVFPPVFSISDNTDEVIALLRKLYTIGKSSHTQSIVFDHSRCADLGLSASTLTDIIVVALQRYRRGQYPELVLKGDLPRNERARDILLASGLPKHLNADSYLTYRKSYVRFFPTESGRCDDNIKKADRIATKLTEYFNKCLKEEGLMLNNTGCNILGKIFGEVLNNCEIHGGMKSTWYTQGHYEKAEQYNYGEMQLMFLTLGNTIYEGLMFDSSDETRQRLKHLENKHSKFKTKNWDDEMIYTVASLQEGISRLRDVSVESYGGRGSGTVHMIQMLRVN